MPPPTWLHFLKPFGCRTHQGDERWPEQQLPCPLCPHWDVNQKLPRGTHLQCTEEIKMALLSLVHWQHLFSPVQLALSLFAIRALSKLRLFFENLIHSPTFMVSNCSLLLALSSFQINSICISIKVPCITPLLMAPCFLIFLPKTPLQYLLLNASATSSARSFPVTVSRWIYVHLLYHMLMFTN